MSARAGARICLVIADFGAGGAERVMATMANHWAEHGRDVTVITFGDPAVKPYYPLDDRVDFRPLGLPSRPLPPLRAMAYSFRRLIALRRALKRIAPDVAISFLTKVNVLTVLAARGLGLPVIVSERNNPARQSFRSSWSRLRDWLYCQAFSVVCQTEAVRKTLAPDVSDRGRVIPNPIAEAAAVTPPERPTIAGDHPDWSLVIWGEGGERERLIARRAELGLADRVRLPGLTERPHQWQRETTVFVLSSRFEGFPNVLGEAMAAGLPAVAFDCLWGPAEMITDGVDGLLVPAENVDGLTAALDRLLRDAPSLARRQGGASAASAPGRSWRHGTS